MWFPAWQRPRQRWERRWSASDTARRQPRDLGARNESTVKSGIFPRRRFETRFFFLYLAEYSMKNFITTRQYLVNLMCNCWFRMSTQFHQKLVSYKCMLFVDCLVVLREYFVNWARVTKFFFFFFSGSNFHPESYASIWYYSQLIWFSYCWENCICAGRKTQILSILLFRKLIWF